MAKIIGENLPNIPWQERPSDCREPLWRFDANPIISRHDTAPSNSIFNSAVVPFRDGFAGIFRCDDRAVTMNLYAGFSQDGIHWRIDDKPLVFEGDPAVTKVEYRYDPRVTKIGKRYYITWCNGYHGPTIGIGYTEDFEHFVQLENAFLPYNRNGVLFPRKIGGTYRLLSRPSDNGHTPFGDIFVSESPDLVFWGRHRHLFGPAPFEKSGWQCTKVGPGPVPIETDEGWLLIYHGVINTCNGFVYRMGAALLDAEEPSVVKGRTRYYIFGPEAPYEQCGDVPNVTFPCAALTDAVSGRIALYYGCADTVTGLAFTTVDILLDFIKKHSL